MALRPGDSGVGVLALQARLLALGFRVRLDGQFGYWAVGSWLADYLGRYRPPDGAAPVLHEGETGAAVRAFQADRGLRVDGVAGPRTLGALEPERGASVLVPGELAGAVAGRAPMDVRLREALA